MTQKVMAAARSGDDRLVADDALPPEPLGGHQTGGYGPDGRVDGVALAALVDTLAQAGVHGLVACGTTGEAATLDENEKALVLDTLLHAGVPVVMGVSGVSPVDVAKQCERWNTTRIAGFLVPPPAYVRPSQQGIIDFYTRVLGLRLAKLTVNFDDPYAYHFYYGDNQGHPGTILTFFAWPGGRRGHRLLVEGQRVVLPDHAHLAEDSPQPQSW